MRIVIVGPGALGCFLAGKLSTQTEVWLLDHDPLRAARIVDHGGIHCEEKEGQHWQAQIPVTARSEDIGIADAVIICTKSYHTREALLHAEPAIGKHTFVLSLQNGIGNSEFISDMVGVSRTAVGVTHHGVIKTAEGRIRHAGEGPTYIGPLKGKAFAELKTLRKILSSAGIQTTISKKIVGILWSKLIVNVGINALTAVTHLKNGQLLNFEGTQEVMALAVEEAVRVARRKKIQLSEKDPLKAVEKVCRATEANISSMLQDILAGRRTEVDYINGIIVEEGLKCRISTPVNTTLYSLVKALEQSFGQRVVRQEA